MFGSLIESGSHAWDVKRKSSFFVGTFAFYLLLLSAVGVGSIYAYDARLEESDELALVSMINFPARPAQAEPERQQPRQASGESREPQFARRPEITVITPYAKVQEEASPTTRTVAPSDIVKIAPDDGRNPVYTGVEIGPYEPGISTGTKPGGPVVVEDETEVAPEVKLVKPEPPQVKNDQPVRLRSEVISSKAVQKPVPAYPDFAKRAGVQGTVAVQILIDEQGRVISAQATSGHTLLQKAAADAAQRARFTPTLLSGHPVKVSGVIYYNFVLN